MTRKSVGLLVGIVAPLALAVHAHVACASPPARVKVTIVHTNDLHGHVENAAAIAAVARAERARNGNTLFLDAGDCITGTPISTVFKGRPVFEIMTLMGYDAAAIGNHEFDHGWKLVSEFRDLAAFPLLCANAADPDGKPLGDEPWHVFDVGGVRVGVLGLLTDAVPTLTPKAASAGCRFESPLVAARRLVPEMRKRADVVVLLTHVGVETDVAIAGAVPGIDLVVGGHSHTELKEPLVVGDTRVVQAKCYGTCVGIVEFTWDGESRAVRDLAARLVAIHPQTMPNAPDVKSLVEAYEAQVAGKVSEVIGRTSRKLTKERLRAAIERIYAEALAADFGYHNMGGIRAEIEPGEIRVRDIWTVLPFDNTLVRMRLKGDAVPKYARRALGDAFDAAKEYVFATNSYVADQQKTYFGTRNVPVEDTGLLMRDVVVEWVRKHGGLEAAGEGSAGAEHAPEPGERP